MSAFFLGHPTETDLALFAGGESGPFARWRIERHVERCPQCQEIAADFFRLPDQLHELAELPNVDWKQMAVAIEAGVRADVAAGQTASRPGFLPPIVWQAGLVAATAVVGVVVFQQMNSPQAEPELIATARMEAPAPVAEPLASQEEVRPEIAQTVPTRREVETSVRESKAVEQQQSLPSDVAAPAAPPPPPPGVLNEVVGRRREVAAESAAVEAESAEARLRRDAAARVGAVLAVGDAAPAAADQAVAFRQARVAWAQMPVEAVNFDGAPISLSGGYTACSGAMAKTPTVAATNRSGRNITGFELVWIVGDADAAATATVERQGLTMAPGAVTASGGERSWRLPDGMASAKMRIYLSSVTFDDGTTWAPTAAQIAGQALSTAGAAQLELLPPASERDDRP